MITDIYKNILKKENLLNLDVFIRDYQTFEEIPLVSRYEHLKFLNEKIKQEDFQVFLINIAFFLLNNIELYAQNRLLPEEYKDYFICITFSDFDEISTFGYVIPNFFVTRKKELLNFLKINQYNPLDGIGSVKSAFSKCGLVNEFKFIKTVSRDELCVNLVRVYAIDRTNALKLAMSPDV